MLDTKLEPREGGVVFYPREYVINKEQRILSYAKGVTEGGREAIAYIIPEEKFILASQDKDNASTVPTIYDFSRKPGKSKNPCATSKENSKEDPKGVILLEQVSLAPEMKPQHNGSEVIVAKWASVISDGAEDSEFAVGVGYLEISTSGKPTAKTVELQSQFSEAEKSLASGSLSPLQVEERKEQLFRQIVGSRTKKFTAVILKPEKTYEVKSNANIETYKSVIKRALLAYTTESGMYGGCIVRVRKGNVVDPTCSYVCNHRFKFENKGPDNVDDVVNNFMKYGGNKAFRIGTQQGNTLEIIPLQRINCAHNGNNRYSSCLMSGYQDSKILKTFVESEKRADPELKYVSNKAFLFANVACRLSVLDSDDYEGNILLSAIHAFSAPKGNFLTIDKNGKSTFKIKGKGFSNQNNGHQGVVQQPPVQQPYQQYQQYQQHSPQPQGY